MRFAVLLVALLTIVVGIGGLVSPNRAMAVRRQYYATPARFYVAGVVRLAMGLVLIVGATASRAPKTLRTFGVLMCMQGLTGTLLGPHRAGAIAEWEAMQGTALLRVAAAVALATGAFMVFAVAGHRPRSAAGSPL